MKPRTEAQKLASRLNGARSKGPVTPEGKAKVSLNAVTHGIHAVNPVLQTENPEEWQLFLNDHIQEWNPLSLPEWNLVVNELAGTEWRLKRLRTTEIALMDLETERIQESVRQACARPDAALLNAAAWESLQSTTGNQALDRLLRHETRLCRIIAQAKSRLQALKADRQNQQYDLDAISQLQPPEPLPAPAPGADAPENKPGQPKQEDPQPRPVLVIRPANPGPADSPLANKPEHPAASGTSDHPHCPVKGEEAA